MPALIELRDIHKQYGEQILLDGVTASIHDNQKVGLIGRNGTGKSTLARIILGEEEADGGEVIFHRDLRLAYLQQHDPFLPDETVEDFLIRDSDKPQWRCGVVAGQFGLKGATLAEPINLLSGGWQTRVKLAALLLKEPNLLLLDEPTNFLDLTTRMILEDCLKAFQGSCLIISHDRTFLRQVCTHTLSLAQGQATTFPGTVDDFLAQQELAEETAIRTNTKVTAKQRQLQTFINKNRAGANTASQARNKQKQLDRLELIQTDSAEAQVRMRLPANNIRRGNALHCNHLAIGYPDLTVARDVHLDLDHGERIAIVGDNGQGKTTFLRTVTDSLPILEGEAKWGYGCETGIYAQHVYSSLPETMTVQSYLAGEAGPGITSQNILNIAGNFLFSGGAVKKTIKVLSGGERARLCMAGLFLKDHNVLVLDEPVNHLDVETASELAEALVAFPGTILFTSHDRTFMERVATRVIEVREGKISLYHGDYPLYVETMHKRIAEASEDSPRKSKQDARQDARPGKQKKKAASAIKPKKGDDRAAFRIQKKITSLERQIEQERRLMEKIDQRFLETTDWQELDTLQAKRKEHEARLQTLEEDWLRLHDSLENA